VRRSGMPGIIGSTGWDRSSAWIWLFVRHEALCFRMGVKDPYRRLVAAGW
jgi:hypothetical protein